MSSPTLPKNAFLPRRQLDERQRQLFFTRRNRMFSLCTVPEQQLLVELAHWYATVPLEPFAKPNIFSKSYIAWFNHRYFPWMNQQFDPITFVLSKVHLLNCKIERWLGARALNSLLARLRTNASSGEFEGFWAAIHFLRELPIEFTDFDVNEVKHQLDALMKECLGSKSVSAAIRLDIVKRFVAWSYEDKGYGSDEANLRKHAWPLLLEVAENDVTSAVKLIDEHWNQTQPPEILMSLNLHEQPELAYKLAVKLKPHRTDFAADMLRFSIFYTSWQLSKVDRAAVGAVEKIMDASCQLLAEWTFEGSCISSQSALYSIGHLFQFGDPQAAYWLKLAPEGLAILKELSSKDLDQNLSLLAQTAFYSVNSQFVGEAFELYKDCVGRKLCAKGDWDWVLSGVIHDVSLSLSILEDKVLSMRNRRIKANPNHPLLQLLETQLEGFLTQLLTAEPASGLQHIVSTTLSLSNETLVRKHHRSLRDEFQARACEHPVDAGLALKKMIQYCGYSQVDHEMYRKDLCKESFDALLPLLESISSTDATVARTGIGWNPRGDI